MPKHYAVGQNIKTGTVAFNNTKTMDITFPISFSKRPSVTLTLGDSNNAPAYKQQVTSTGLKIRFKAPYSGDVEWVAMENGED